jgi:hypothetical protein
MSWIPWSPNSTRDLYGTEERTVTPPKTDTLVLPADAIFVKMLANKASRGYAIIVVTTAGEIEGFPAGIDEEWLSLVQYDTRFCWIPISSISFIKESPVTTADLLEDNRVIVRNHQSTFASKSRKYLSLDRGGSDGRL